MRDKALEHVLIDHLLAFCPWFPLETGYFLLCVLL